jgi:hypothetical protein
MEEAIQANSGVESAQVADVQSQETQQTFESSENTGVESPVVAGQVKDEKDFSSALKARETQLRQQIEQEYSTKMQESQTKLNYMEKQAKIYGYETVDEYIKALDEHERQQEIQKEAEKYGVPEDFIRGELKPLKDELEQLKQERAQLTERERERQLQSDLEKVKSANPDFDQYFDAVADLFKQGYSLEHAYRLASYEDKMSKLGQEKEQEVLARVTGRDQKQVLSSNDKPANLAFSPANMSTADIMDISRRVQAGEKIKFN